jgi:hypothetical protein
VKSVAVTSRGPFELIEKQNFEILHKNAQQIRIYENETENVREAPMSEVSTR